MSTISEKPKITQVSSSPTRSVSAHGKKNSPKSITGESRYALGAGALGAVAAVAGLVAAAPVIIEIGVSIATVGAVVQVAQSFNKKNSE